MLILICISAINHVTTSYKCNLKIKFDAIQFEFPNNNQIKLNVRFIPNEIIHYEKKIKYRYFLKYNLSETDNLPNQESHMTSDLA